MPASIKEHCFTKKELKVFAFTMVSVKNALLWRAIIYLSFLITSTVATPLVKSRHVRA